MSLYPKNVDICAHYVCWRICQCFPHLARRQADQAVQVQFRPLRNSCIVLLLVPFHWVSCIFSCFSLSVHNPAGWTCDSQRRKSCTCTEVTCWRRAHAGWEACGVGINCYGELRSIKSCCVRAYTQNATKDCSRSVTPHKEHCGTRVWHAGGIRLTHDCT